MPQPLPNHLAVICEESLVRNMNRMEILRKALVTRFEHCWLTIEAPPMFVCGSFVPRVFAAKKKPAQPRAFS